MVVQLLSSCGCEGKAPNQRQAPTAQTCSSSITSNNSDNINNINSSNRNNISSDMNI